jgi:hypothetical protein
MATTEEIARDLLASLNTDAGFLNAVKWIGYRYRELCSRFRPRHLREIGELQVPARVSTGSVAVTRDSQTVTGSSTTWATAPTTTDVATNWYFRADSAWYQCASFSSDTELSLTTAYSEDTGSSKTYNIVKRFHSLTSTARWLGDAVLTRLRIPIEVTSIDSLDRMAPGRTIVGAYPDTMCQVGTDSSGDLQVELYPYNDDSEIIHYVYWSMPSSLSITTTIPPQVEAHALKEGALIDLYRYMMANALDKGRIEQAAVYRNEMRSQMSTWENFIRSAQRTDRGVDDTTLILSHIGRGQRYYSGDIRNARDEVFYRGNRSW